MSKKGTGKSIELEGELLTVYKDIVIFIGQIILIAKRKAPSEDNDRNARNDAIIELFECKVDGTRNYWGKNRIHLPFSATMAKTFNKNVKKYFAQIPILKSQLQERLKASKVAPKQDEIPYAKIREQLAKLEEFPNIIEVYNGWQKELDLFYKEDVIAGLNGKLDFKDPISFFNYTEWTIDAQVFLSRAEYRLSRYTLSIFKFSEKQFFCELRSPEYPSIIKGTASYSDAILKADFYHEDKEISFTVYIDVTKLRRVFNKSNFGNGILEIVQSHQDSEQSVERLRTTVHQSLGSSITTMYSQIRSEVNQYYEQNPEKKPYARIVKSSSE